MVQCFQLAIHCTLICTLVFDIFRPTSSTFLILLIHCDFWDLPEANFQNLNNVHKGWAESDAVGRIVEFSMTVVIHPSSCRALTALSITRMTSLTYMLFVSFVSNIVLVSDLIVIGRMISGSLVVSQCDLENRTSPWPIRPLHIHRQIVMSHISDTEMKLKLTCTKIGTLNTFPRDTSS